MCETPFHPIEYNIINIEKCPRPSSIKGRQFVLSRCAPRWFSIILYPASSSRIIVLLKPQSVINYHYKTKAVEMNKFVIRSRNGAIMCLFDRTEDRIIILT